MYICPDCGKEFKIKGTHWVKHSPERVEEFKKYSASGGKASAGTIRPETSRKLLGHKPTFSRNVLGERYDEINAERKKSISENANVEACKRGAHLGHEARRKLEHYGLTEKGVLRLSETMTNTMTNREPWNIGLTKYTNSTVKHIADVRRKYPEGVDFRLFGWTLERAQEIRKRDKFICQKCGKLRSSIVHHRNGDKCCNTNENLVTVCRACHKEIHMTYDEKGRYTFRLQPLQF